MYLLKKEFLVRINMAVGTTTDMYAITALCYIGLPPNRVCIGLVAIQKIR
jgi:hypothetical protein